MLLLCGCSAAPRSYDVVVYGATASGTIASIAAAAEGARVALLEPGRHVGGMVSGGLGKTDHGKKQLIGGMSREFFERVGRRYGEPITWYFEPHVAENVFREWLAEAGVDVLFDHRLREVERRGSRIHRVVMENGARVDAKVFIDASYEGDLLAAAGVGYTVGREGRDEYDESLAGVQAHSPYHQFDVDLSPYRDDGGLLPLVHDGEPGRPGQGDRKVQAYNFRLCLTDRIDNQVPLPQPPGYDPARYELLRRYLAKKPGLTMTDVMIVSPMPNGKTDINNRGPISTDFIGENWAYPEASYTRRREIRDAHKHYIQGFLYFLANDPSVPAPLQAEVLQWGLAADEFVDTDHWPHQLYVREARRMIGAHVMTQADVQVDTTKPDSVGMGSYQADSHHVQRVPTPEDTVVNEGDVQVSVQGYEIAYRSLTPKRGECENLLVPVCLSASHVAYCTIRMEPVYMILGHSAGAAATAAAHEGLAVQDVDATWLQHRLREQGQILALRDAE